MTQTKFDQKKIAETQQKVWSAHIARVKKGFKKVVAKQKECYEQQLADKNSEITLLKETIAERDTEIKTVNSRLADTGRNFYKVWRVGIDWKVEKRTTWIFSGIFFIAVLIFSVVRLIESNVELRRDRLFVEYLFTYLPEENPWHNVADDIRSDRNERRRIRAHIRQHENRKQ